MRLVADAVSGLGTQLRECPGCGLLHEIPQMAPGVVARCTRCPTGLLRRASHPFEYSIALTVAALVFLVVMCSPTLMAESKGIML